MNDLPNQYLADKFYLFSVGFFATVVGFLGVWYLIYSVIKLPMVLVLFIIFFVIAFVRVWFDQLVIYGLKVHQLSLKGNAIFSGVSASAFTILCYYLIPLLGEWTPFVTMIVSMKIMVELKKIIPGVSDASLQEANGQLNLRYIEKFQQFMKGFYGFFLIIVLITHGGVQLFGVDSFYHAFAMGIFLALLFEQIYAYTNVYNIRLTTSVIFRLIIIALFFAIFGSATTFTLMQFVGMSGKTATIIGVIAIKLIQPLVSYRKI
ncbi:MAG: hypothetical protein UV38_C0002G0191 [candidate division TM6 bacterium GW2011_GWE2_42_60]|nr:MAG: hypothetical protein UV38_C0002G0191 [candidate division TM6 bacterium GW2011_GWE2_42_60]HBY06054.1 hypothetical protein [Candidatus Dependentiae bacterium]